MLEGFCVWQRRWEHSYNLEHHCYPRQNFLGVTIEGVMEDAEDWGRYSQSESKSVNKTFYHDMFYEIDS